MSRLIKFTGIAVLMSALIILGAPIKKANAQPNVSVSFQMFYNNLQPYGQWINYGQHGYCWVPNNVGSNFRPYYSNGHWVMTDYGNTWVSDYSWGWAPFHYGRWTYDDYYGWIWVPGNTWGPAWVSWRNGGGYYGWAPLAPGINVNIAIGPRSYCSNDWWVFIPQRHIYSNRFQRYWRGAQYNTTIINRTTVINNTYVRGNRRYVAGPRRASVQQATGRPVRTYGVRSGLKPGRSQVRGNTLSVYNPNVRQRNNERPQRVATRSNVRTGRPGGATRNTASAPRRVATPSTNRPTQQRAVTQSRLTYNKPRANTQRNTQASRQPQQQRKITDRRQQSWQPNRQPTRSQSAQRSNTQSRPTYNRTQANRNTQRARTQTRPTQRTRATQSRPQTSRSSSAQRSSSRSSRGSGSSASRGRR